MNDVVSPLCGTSHPCGDLEVGRAVPAADIPSWFPGGLAFEMGRKDGWDQYSGHLGRGHLGTVDLGADGSLGVLSLVDILRGVVKRSGEGVCWGSFGGEGWGRNQQKNLYQYLKQLTVRF